MVRDLGYVISQEDRVLIFPNTFQHRVDSFELVDKTKKGHRKILCLFVVDPYNDLVVTTKQVPPQQEDWWNDSELLSKDYPEAAKEGKIGPLVSMLIPDSIKKQILDLKKGSDWPQTLADAIKVREALMEERSAATKSSLEDDMGAWGRPFSLCEH